jgi:hypothetical protein
LLEDLIIKFILCRKYTPSNVNDLLDFLQKEYVHGEISIDEYRNLFRELNARGAVKPSYTNEFEEAEYKVLA